LFAWGGITTMTMSHCRSFDAMVTCVVVVGVAFGDYKGLAS
jgi:hypothetical protein